MRYLSFNPASRFIVLFILSTLLLLVPGCKKEEETTIEEQRDVVDETYSNPNSAESTPEHVSGSKIDNATSQTPMAELKTNETAKKKQSQPKKSKIVAKVDGRPINELDLKGVSIEDAIADEILYQEGLRQGRDKRLEGEIEKYKKRLIVLPMRDEIMKDRNTDLPVADEEIEEYYNNNKANYTRLTVKLVAADDRKIAEEIHKKATEGKVFKEIKRDYEESPDRVIYREFILSRQEYDVFDSLEPGTISDIKEKGDQFAVYKITHVKTMDPSMAKQGIKRNIEALRKQQAVRDYAEKIKNDNNVKVEIFSEGIGQ